MRALVGLGEGNRVQELARVEAAELIGAGPHRDALQRFAQPEVVEHLDRVGALLDAGADLAELGRLLEHAHAKAPLQQAGGGGQAAEAGAGDEDGLRHGAVSTLKSRQCS